VSAPSELSEHAAALYRGPLAEFTAARNRLAAELKVRDKALAAEVKALAKPSVSAWAVDQLFWREEPRFAAFLAATAAVRDVLRTGAGPSERHVAARRHRDAHADLLARAQTILTDAGHGVAPTLLRRIGTTLEAIAARGWPELGPGCLAEDLDPPGFDDTFAKGELAPRQAEREPAVEHEPAADPAPAPVRPSKRDAALAAAREDAARTARELDARRAESDDADAKARDAADAHDALEHELRELQRKVDRAASSRARAQATAEAQRERLAAASEDHERATTKLRALDDD
jgi:hypothetical protein